MIYEKFQEQSHAIPYPNSKDPDFLKNRTLYGENQRKVVEDFEKALLEEYTSYFKVTEQKNVMDVEIFLKKIIDYAWREGHSGGFSEVENIFQDLIELGYR